MQTLHQLFEQYINECSYVTRLRPETIRGYKAVFTLFTKLMPEVIDLEMLSPAIMQTFFKCIETRVRPVGRSFSRGVKNSTIRTQYAKLNVFFEWLKRNGHLQQNPLSLITPPQVHYDDFKRLTDEDVCRIYAAVVQHAASSFCMRRDAVIVSLLLYCGLRKGELIGLRVGDIDLLNRTITIRGETSKSKRTRTLAIHPTLAMHLRDYLKERLAVSCKSGQLVSSAKADTGLTAHGLKHWTKRVADYSGVQFHLHQFRHTFATKLAEANVHIVKIQKLLGHTDISMTMRYLRSIAPEELEEDIRKLSF